MQKKIIKVLSCLMLSNVVLFTGCGRIIGSSSSQASSSASHVTSSSVSSVASVSSEAVSSSVKSETTSVEASSKASSTKTSSVESSVEQSSSKASSNSSSEAVSSSSKQEVSSSESSASISSKESSSEKASSTSSESSQQISSVSSIASSSEVKSEESSSVESSVISVSSEASSQQVSSSSEQSSSSVVSSEESSSQSVSSVVSSEEVSSQSVSSVESSEISSSEGSSVESSSSSSHKQININEDYGIYFESQTDNIEKNVPFSIDLGFINNTNHLITTIYFEFVTNYELADYDLVVNPNIAYSKYMTTAYIEPEVDEDTGIIFSIDGYYFYECTLIIDYLDASNKGDEEAKFTSGIVGTMSFTLNKNSNGNFLIKIDTISEALACNVVLSQQLGSEIEADGVNCDYAIVSNLSFK